MSQLKKRKETAKELRKPGYVPLVQSEAKTEAPEESLPEHPDYMEQLKKAKRRTKN
jgi:hypothetical protein